MPTSTRWQRGKLVFSGTNVILGDLLSRRRNFELRTSTLARQVLVENDVAVGLLVEDRVDGRRYDVHARYVVVCAAALRTPQLLHASNIRPFCLYRYLNEHPQVSASVKLHEEFAPHRYESPPRDAPRRELDHCSVF